MVEGYQAQNVDAIRADRVVCTVRAGQLRVKAFQIVFHKDGSFFISFPYFRHRTGLLSISSIPATGTGESQVNLEHGGKVTSHLVKYSHHVDGRAHFSQDGKIFTVIKRQSIALDKQHGHIFSLLIQGLTAFAASPYANARYVLAISCISINALGPEPEIFMFYGGFSAPEIMTDPAREAGFLAFLYPIGGPEQLRQRLGSVDFVPRPRL